MKHIYDNCFLQFKSLFKELNISNKEPDHNERRYAAPKQS